LTSAVIIILREVLEAMLLICTLMATARALKLNLKWLPFAIAAGIAGALTFAMLLESITEMFDGFGQEIVNSCLLVLVALTLALHNFLALRVMAASECTKSRQRLIWVMSAAVAMAMTWEGAEIYLYVYSYGVLAGESLPVLSGAVIGAGIGLSIGTFFYYGLRMLAPRLCLYVCTAFIVIISAGMVSQVALYMSQADILSSSAPLWDTSSFISETSLLGELLHASIGYEANPTLNQLLLCLGFGALALGAVAFALILNSKEEGA